MSSAGVKTKQRFVSFQPYYSASCTEIILYIATQHAIMNQNVAPVVIIPKN